MTSRSTQSLQQRRFSVDTLNLRVPSPGKPQVWSTQINKDPADLSPLPSNERNGTNFIKNGVKPKRKTPQKRRAPKSPTESSPQPSFVQKVFSWRYLIVLLLHTSFVVAVFQRNCMPMALVCMVDQSTRVDDSNETRANASHVFEDASDIFWDASGGRNLTHHRNHSSLYDGRFQHNDTAKDSEFEFDWDPEIQGLVLTSVSFSSFMGPLLAERLRRNISNKATLSFFTLVASLLTLLTPAAARLDPLVLIAVRVLHGISFGANVPVLGETMAWWSPKAEKLTIVALTFTGLNIGGTLSSFISGFLCSISVDNGWPFIFYVFGICGIIWTLCWHFFSTTKPERHPYISDRELEYIVENRVGMEDTGKKVKPPYRTILTSRPVLAFIYSATCHLWVSNIVFTYVPIYLTKVSKFAVQEVGVLTSLISCARFIGGLAWTSIGNLMLAKKIRITYIRKGCIFVGFTASSLFVLAVGFFDSDLRIMAVVFLMLSMLNQAVGSSTLTVLPLDMAPRYAGFLSGFMVFTGNLSSISGPLMVAAITRTGTLEEWRTVWIILTIVFLSAGVVFLLFGDASLQPWAKAERKSVVNVVSPFVTMGRRFSAFIDTPPIPKTTSPTANKSNFAFDVDINASSILPVLMESQEEEQVPEEEGEEDGTSKSGDDSSCSLSDACVEEGGRSDRGDREKEVGVDNLAFESESAISGLPKRKRAFSEFGLELLRVPSIDLGVPGEEVKDSGEQKEDVGTAGMGIQELGGMKGSVDISACHVEESSGKNETTTGVESSPNQGQGLSVVKTSYCQDEALIDAKVAPEKDKRSNGISHPIGVHSGGNVAQCTRL